MNKTEVIHPCRCKSYNGGQCYNCLNGAHSICSGDPKCRKQNSPVIGLPIRVICERGAKQRRWRNDCKIRGLCVRCAKQPPTGTLVHCASCQKKVNYISKKCMRRKYDARKYGRTMPDDHRKHP
jgi:hypothetical protein